jgi:HEPN domain-containing protein
LKKGITLAKKQGKNARVLDRHYIPTRYANAHAEGAPFEFYDLPTANKAVKYAEEMLKFVEEIAEHG